MGEERSVDAIRQMLRAGRQADVPDEDVARIRVGSEKAIEAVAETIDFSVFECAPAEFYAVLERLGDEHGAE